MDFSIGGFTIVATAAFLESVRQGHYSAIPLFFLVLGLAYYIVLGRKKTVKSAEMPKLERIIPEEEEDEFAHVALSNLEIYFLPEQDKNASAAATTVSSATETPAEQTFG